MICSPWIHHVILRERDNNRRVHSNERKQAVRTSVRDDSTNRAQSLPANMSGAHQRYQSMTEQINCQRYVKTVKYNWFGWPLKINESTWPRTHTLTVSDSDDIHKTVVHDTMHNGHVKSYDSHLAERGERFLICCSVCFSCWFCCCCCSSFAGGALVWSMSERYTCVCVCVMCWMEGMAMSKIAKYAYTIYGWICITICMPYYVAVYPSSMLGHHSKSHIYVRVHCFNSVPAAPGKWKYT